MPGEQSVDEPDLVDEEQPEHEAQEAGGEPQVPVDPREPPGRIQEGRRDGDGDQHHSDDGSDSEEQEVRDGPPGSLNDRENEQRDGRRSRQAVKQPDDQGPGKVVATAISMVRPSRGGMTMLNRMIAAPTTTMVSVCPIPQRIPIRSAARSVRCRVTMVLTAMTWSGSVA